MSKWWYASVFSPKMWSITLGSMFVMSIIVTGMVSLKKHLSNHYRDVDCEFLSASYNLLCIFGNVSGQGKLTNLSLDRRGKVAG